MIGPSGKLAKLTIFHLSIILKVCLLRNKGRIFLTLKTCQLFALIQSFNVHVHKVYVVADALVEIVDGDGNPMETQYYNPGSEIELTCIIRNRSHWSTKTVWLKDQLPLDLYHRPTVR